MIETKKVLREETQIIAAKCDGINCGKEFDNLTVECQGYGKIRISFGFGSVNDESTFEAELCDHCFEKLKKIINFREVQK